MKKLSPEMEEFTRQITEFLPYLLREMMRRERSEMTRGNVSLPQMLTIDLLSRKERVKMKELAEFLSIKMSSATALVDRLIRQKILKRSRDEKDRRIVWVRATERGKKVIEEIYREKRKSVASIFGTLSEKDRSQHLRIITKIKLNLSAQPPT